MLYSTDDGDSVPTPVGHRKVELVANDDPELVAIPTDIHCGLGGIPVRLSTNNILIVL